MRKMECPASGRRSLREAAESRGVVEYIAWFNHQRLPESLGDMGVA
jgi:hypothetical protein